MIRAIATTKRNQHEGYWYPQVSRVDTPDEKGEQGMWLFRHSGQLDIGRSQLTQRKMDEHDLLRNGINQPHEQGQKQSSHDSWGWIGNCKLGAVDETNKFGRRPGERPVGVLCQRRTRREGHEYHGNAPRSFGDATLPSRKGDTHNFEAHFCDGLPVPRYAAPQARLRAETARVRRGVLR